ncbi:DUF3139 domain-containing protein [Alkalihalophilus marmarensis]|jgi:hypothetical protein|uniref:DUF3139 domain-containing protein n=1 Tax=Alkalihalophilus marmarensis DSM 21297 TaxID=1188261 RepID=U6SL39_9BACI|nr:DUF3139 domain-containing protein [Alkalihalophilus marmarensis]ERN51321.1 hypothetical protein A33I_20535 [Alkalihalophilus marmarensis DSM 21297]MCM3490603.1 DUF3139 domain-containing protein [Alkalihalophilus marmarensis]
MKLSLKFLYFVVAILIVIILTITIYNYRLNLVSGSEIEKNRILQETIWTLQEEGYTKDDIHFVSSDFNYSKGQSYEAYVAFEEDHQTFYIYTWNDPNKKEFVKRVGQTGNVLND